MSGSPNVDVNTPRWIWFAQKLGPLLALAVVIVVFWIADSWQEDGGTFLTVRNAQVVLAQTAVVAIAALGMTIIIISGGIDLSVGTAMILSAVVLAAALDHQWSIGLAVIACLASGCLVGLFNGLLINFLRIVPFVVTLGTMTICLGVGKYFAAETTVRPPLANIPDWLGGLVSTRQEFLLAGLPMGVWLTLVLAVAVAAMLRYTVFGRHVYALGSNESTARLCGINVPLTKIAIYGVAGVFVGVAGICYFAKLKSVNPTAGLGFELRVIAAVVIGGGSLSGGHGSVLGTLTGALIMGVIYSGCTQLGVRNLTTDILIGAIIIAAVTLDQIRQRRLAA